MAMPADSATGVLWTREHVLDLIDRTPESWIRYELVDGELIVTPAPALRHQVAHSRLMGLVLSGPADIALDPARKSYLQPDIFVVPHDATWPLRSWRDISTLRLVVEILSPSTESYDRGLKRRYYLRHGVPEVWLGDLDERYDERWRASSDAPDVQRDAISWQPDAVLPALRLDLTALFVEALGEE